MSSPVVVFYHPTVDNDVDATEPSERKKRHVEIIIKTIFHKVVPQFVS
jgi:hypothetical protein